MGEYPDRSGAFGIALEIPEELLSAVTSTFLEILLMSGPGAQLPH